jgi:hypothetical protein
MNCVIVQNVPGVLNRVTCTGERHFLALAYLGPDRRFWNAEAKTYM